MSYTKTRLRQQQEIEPDFPGHNPQPIAGKAIWPVRVLDAPGVIGPDLARYVVAIQKGVQVTGLKVGRDGSVLPRANAPFSFTLGQDNYTFLLKALSDGFTGETYREFAVRNVSTAEPIYVAGRRPFRTSSIGWSQMSETVNGRRIIINPEVRPPRIRSALLGGTKLVAPQLDNAADLKQFIPRDVRGIQYEPNDIRYLAAAADQTFGYTWRFGRRTQTHQWTESDSYIYQASAPPRTVFFRNRDFIRLPIETESGFDIFGIGLIYTVQGVQQIVSIHNRSDLEQVWLQLFEQEGRNPGALEDYQFVVYRAARYAANFSGRQVVNDFMQFRQGFSANANGLVVTLKQFDRRDNLLNQSTQTISPRNGNDPETGVLIFNTHTPEPVAKLEVETADPTLLSAVYVGSPRTFNSDSIQIYELDAQPGADLFVQGIGPAVRIPNNATANTDLSLSFSGSWDGKTFKEGRTNDPAWTLLNVLTADAWKIRLPLARIDLQSFYQTSLYNNGLNSQGRQLTDKKWCFDGPLTGNSFEVVNTLLNSMNCVLNQSNNGIMTLGQERPDVAKWIVDQTIATGPLVYREANVKPAVVSRFIDQDTGNEQLLPVLEIKTVVQEYKGQNPACAKRHANWQTFAQSNLLNSVEFTTPIKIEDGSDCYRMALYDLIEIHDNLISGAITSGRIVGVDGATVTLDILPRNLLPVTGLQVLYNNTNTNGWISTTNLGPLWMKIQSIRGGITEHRITRARWNPCDPKQNQFDLAGVGAVKPGQLWALANPEVAPRRFRIISIQEGEGGLTQQVLARPYLNDMHEFVDVGSPVPSRDNFVYRPGCGTSLTTFQGPFNQLPQNYPSDSIGELRSSCVSPL